MSARIESARKKKKRYSVNFACSVRGDADNDKRATDNDDDDDDDNDND